MNGLRYEQGTPVKRRKPLSRAWFMKLAAWIMVGSAGLVGGSPRSPSPLYSGERGWGEGVRMGCIAPASFTHTHTTLTSGPPPLSTGRGEPSVDEGDGHVLAAAALDHERLGGGRGRGAGGQVALLGLLQLGGVLEAED